MKVTIFLPKGNQSYSCINTIQSWNTIYKKQNGIHVHLLVRWRSRLDGIVSYTLLWIQYMELCDCCQLLWWWWCLRGQYNSSSIHSASNTIACVYKMAFTTGNTARRFLSDTTEWLLLLFPSRLCYFLLSRKKRPNNPIPFLLRWLHFPSFSLCCAVGSGPGCRQSHRWSLPTWLYKLLNIQL